MRWSKPPLTDVLAVSGSLEDGRVVLAAREFAVHFINNAGSWSHQLAFETIAVPSVIGNSFESDPARDHPARIVSPVFQEAHRHDPNGSVVGLLLTGNWFQHHFSAAISLSADPHAEHGVVFDVDVADRCRSPVEVLAATYVISLDSGALLSASPDRIEWQLDGSLPGRLELVAGLGTSLAMAEAGRAATRVQVLAAIEPGAFTHRLRYQWRWATR